MADPDRPHEPAPGLVADELVLAPPPVPTGRGDGLQGLVQVLGSVVSLLLVAGLLGSRLGGRWHVVLVAALCLVTGLGTVAVVGERRRWRNAMVRGPRAAYLAYLATVVETAREASACQHAILLHRHPAPVQLPALAEEGSRVWERDDLLVRYGVSDQSPSLTLVPPQTDPLRPAEPELVAAVARLLTTHAVQPDLPAVVDLGVVDRLEVCGAETEARAVARSLVCAAATFHTPEQLAVAVLTTPASAGHWSWTKWLPHVRSPRVADALGGRRMVTADPAELTSWAPIRGHLVLVVDGDVEPPPHRESTTIIAVSRKAPDCTPPAGLLLLLGETHDSAASVAAQVLRPHATPCGVVADLCDVATAEALARRLAARAAESRPAPGRGRGDLLHLLGADDARRLDPPAMWARRSAADRLRVPVGVDDDGRALLLDLKESAEHGMGPHGLVVGATGSGKSELLRTVVVGLALTHSPEQLNLVMIDFKGGATFAGLADLPHVSALVTNLAEEALLVARMQEVLDGELVRRQELLRAAGNLASVRDHEVARGAGAPLPPLPSLLVVVDEFSELLGAQPDLVDLFVAIGRLGRSLGIHLLLATQRLEEGRLRGLDSHLSFRIALRTFSAQESRTVLGVPDAYHLPPVPGLGFLQCGPDAPVRFRAAFVSGPLGPSAPLGQPDRRILPFTVREVPMPPGPRPEATSEESVLTQAVTRLHGMGPPVRRLWSPPLDESATLDTLMPDLAPDDQLGLVSHHWRRTSLTFPIGVVDRPRQQRRDPLTVELAGSGGHVAVVGAPRSGTSTALRTLVASIALTTTPRESQLYVLDLGGGAFSAYDGLPHVAGVAHRTEPDVVRRVVTEVASVLARRETWFRDHGIDSMTTYRSRLAVGSADDGHGDVYLVVDGWGVLQAEHEDLQDDLLRIARRGLSYGCHLLTAATRWADYRPAVRDLLGTRIELRLGDAHDSEADRRAAAVVPRGRPGHGLVDGPFHVLVALPRIDGRSDPSTLAEGVAHLVRQVSQAWPGPSASRLPLLPGLLPVERLRVAATSGSRQLVLGVGERDLAPVGLDADVEPHWLVLGDPGSGKTGALRRYLDEVVRTRSPREAQVVLVDPRWSLLGEVAAPYLLHHLSSEDAASAALEELASHLERRLPGPGVTATQLRDRSWWTGAEAHVVVDDHDLLVARAGSPLLALQPLLGRAREVGLHLVVARRTGGIGRALYEPMLQTLRDLATPALLLSGSPEEGPLVGSHRAVPMPPGRGRLVTRDRGVETIQVAWRDPTR